MLEVITYLILGTALFLIFSQLSLFFAKTFQNWHTKKEARISKEMDNMFMFNQTKRFAKLYFILPLVLGISAAVIFKSVLPVIIGALLGLGLPAIILKQLEVIRRKKLQSQLLDSLMLTSSCLRAGLSLLQAIDVLVEEMPAPISQEFGYVTKEVRMGIGLEDALKKMNERLKLEEMELIVNSILVGRETGGDLIKVFSRLQTTFRDRQKLRETIRTFTLQGRIQALIMSFIPFAFAYIILMNNRHHFDVMLNSDIGRFLLMLAVVLQVVGMVLVNMFSKINV